MTDANKGRIALLLEELDSIVEGRRDYAKKPLKRAPQVRHIFQKLVPIRRRFERVSKQSSSFQHDVTNLRTYLGQALRLLQGKPGAEGLVKRIETLRSQSLISVENFNKVHGNIDDIIAQMEQFAREIPAEASAGSELLPDERGEKFSVKAKTEPRAVRPQATRDEKKPDDTQEKARRLRTVIPPQNLKAVG